MGRRRATAYKHTRLSQWTLPLVLEHPNIFQLEVCLRYRFRVPNRVSLTEAGQMTKVGASLAKQPVFPMLKTTCLSHMLTFELPNLRSSLLFSAPSPRQLGEEGSGPVVRSILASLGKMDRFCLPAMPREQIGLSNTLKSRPV